jgi:hypothetical protein
MKRKDGLGPELSLPFEGNIFRFPVVLTGNWKPGTGNGFRSRMQLILAIRTIPLNSNGYGIFIV